MKQCTHRIYALKDPNTLEIRYIGVTTQKLSQRLANHVYYSKKRNCTHVHNWILSLINQGKYPMIEQVDCANENNWEQKEKEWISKTVNLTNIDSGGKGIIRNRSKSSRERSAIKHQVAIVQLSLTGELIEEHESITIAARKTKTCRTGIDNVLGNRAKTSNHFQWVYKSDYDESIENKTNVIGGYKKQVIRINTEDNTVKRYDSLSQAAISNHISIARLSTFILTQQLFCIFKFIYSE